MGGKVILKDVRGFLVMPDKKNLKKTSDKNNYAPILDHKIEDFKKTIKNLSQEVALKDSIIQEYKKQLETSSRLISQISKKSEEDLQNLHTLYENIVPTQFPSIPDCEFSFKFISSPKGQGKDFYQVIPLQKLHFGLLISSCVSHILSSLLISSRLSLMNRSDYKTLQPHETLSSIKKEVFENLNPAQPKKIDIFYSVVNQKKYTLSYCQAGSIYACLYSYDSKSFKDLSLDGDQSSFEKKTLSSSLKLDLNPKDHLILCSPGVFECTNIKGDNFTSLLLKEAILKVKKPGAHLIRNSILYSLKSFCKGSPLMRDQSIFVMEIQDKILKLTS